MTLATSEVVLVIAVDDRPVMSHLAHRRSHVRAIRKILANFSSVLESQ
jgi:hypothetical protein